jgi:biotin carboxyl carrier protein
MRLKVELSGVEHSLLIKREGGRVFAEVDGRKYELEVRERGGNEYLLFENVKVYDCRVELLPDIFTVHVRRHGYPIRIIDPKRLRSTESVGRHDHGSVEIVAPMPGKVVRVLVAEGAEVAAGSGILVVEAMKMQNELKTPKGGRVVSIRVDSGATVNAGEVLAVVE